MHLLQMIPGTFIANLLLANRAFMPFGLINTTIASPAVEIDATNWKGHSNIGSKIIPKPYSKE